MAGLARFSLARIRRKDVHCEERDRFSACYWITVPQVRIAQEVREQISLRLHHDGVVRRNMGVPKKLDVGLTAHRLVLGCKCHVVG